MNSEQNFKRLYINYQKCISIVCFINCFVLSNHMIQEKKLNLMDDLGNFETIQNNSVLLAQINLLCCTKDLVLFLVFLICCM